MIDMADQIWKHMNPCGRPPKYKTEEELWAKFIEYVNWCDDNPVPVSIKKKATQKQGRSNEQSGTKEEQTVPRPYTVYGWQAWSMLTNWSQYRKEHPDFVMVIRAIDTAITSQQVDGAMAGLYNSNLTARLNGLVDRQETIDSSRKMSPEDFDKLFDIQ